VKFYVFMVQKWHHPAWQTHPPRRGTLAVAPFAAIAAKTAIRPQTAIFAQKRQKSWRNMAKRCGKQGQPQGIAPTVRTLYGKFPTKWQKICLSS